MLKRLFLFLPVLLASSCITIKDARLCSVAGDLSAGGICSHLLTDETEDLSFSEFLDFLEAKPATDSSHAHAAAICMSSDDWSQMKTELEQACRKLGKRCNKAVVEKIVNFKLVPKVNR